MTQNALVPAARRLHLWLLALALVLFVSLVMEMAANAGLFQARSGWPARLGWQFCLTLPVWLQWVALWQVRGGVAALAKGADFGPALTRAIARVGGFLIAASLLAIFWKWLTPYFPQVAMAWSRRLDVDVANLVLGGLGFALLLLARMLDEAAAMRAELDGFF